MCPFVIHWRVRRASITFVLLATLGGLFLTFPPLWLATLLGIVCVVTLQILLVRRHLYRQVPTRSQQKQMARGMPLHEVERRLAEMVKRAKGTPPPTHKPTASVLPQAQVRSAQATGHPPPPSTSKKPTLKGIDPGVFQRFQQHLQQASKKLDAPPQGVEGGDVQDTVKISTKVPPNKPAKVSALEAVHQTAATVNTKNAAAKQGAPTEKVDLVQSSPFVSSPDMPVENSSARTGLTQRPALEAQNPALPLREPVSVEWEDTLSNIETDPTQPATPRNAPMQSGNPEATMGSTTTDQAQRMLQQALAAEKDNHWAEVEKHLTQYDAVLGKKNWSIGAIQLHLRTAIQGGHHVVALQGARRFALQLLHAGNFLEKQVEAQFLKLAIPQQVGDQAAIWRFSLLLAASQALQSQPSKHTQAWSKLLTQAQEGLSPTPKTVEALDTQLKAHQKLPQSHAAQHRLLNILGKFCFHLKRNPQAQQYYKMELALNNQAASASTNEGATSHNP